MGNKPFSFPEEIKINRQIAEDLRLTLKSTLEHEERHGELLLTEFNRTSINAFLELMEAKEKSSLNYLTKCLQQPGQSTDQP